MGATAKKQDESTKKKDDKKELDSVKLVEKWAKEAEVEKWIAGIRAGFKTEIAAQLEIPELEVTDQQVYACVHTLQKSGNLDETLRDMGLVPKPSIFSALVGWHDYEHLRARGAANKIAGLTSIGAKIGILVFGAMKGMEYLAR